MNLSVNLFCLQFIQAMNSLGKEAGFLCVWMLHLAHRALQWPLTPEKWIMRLYDLWAYPITHAWGQPPMNICKANWLSFFQNLPSFRCLQINSTAARSSVLRNQYYTNQYHLMFCFTHPIFPVLLGVDIASLSCVFTPYTTKTVLIHDYGAPVLPKTPTSNTLLWWPLGSPCSS